MTASAQALTELLGTLTDQIGALLKEEDKLDAARESTDPYRHYMINYDRRDRLRAEITPTFIRAVKLALTCETPTEENEPTPW